jgi:hypothetical protein
MNISTRSVLMAGVATLTITATAAAPSVQPLPSPQPEIQLAALVQQPPLPPPAPANLPGWVQRILVPPSAGKPFPTPQFPPVVVGNSLGSSIENIYNAVEPWVEWGFQVAAYAVGWIPYVGWLSGQVMIFYYFGEQIVHSIVFNIADWVDGDISFGQGLVNVGIETVNAFIYLANAQLAFWLPPLPPIPPIPCPFCNTLAATTLVAPGAPEVGVQNVASDLVNAIYVPVRNTIDYGVSVFQDVLAPIPVVRIVGDQTELLWNTLAEPISNSVVFDLIDPVLNQPLNINSYLNGAYDVGATTVNSLINTGIAEVNYFLGIPFSAQASTQARELDRTAEVSTVPSIVKNTLTGVRNVDSGATAGKTATPGPLNEVRETVRDVRNVIREATGRSAVETTKSGDEAKNVGNEVVRTRHDVRGAITKAVDDVTGALGTGKPTKSADGATKASTNVVKSLGDTAKNVVKQVRQAVKDARDTVGNRPSADADK